MSESWPYCEHPFILNDNKPSAGMGDLESLLVKWIDQDAVVLNITILNKDSSGYTFLTLEEAKSFYAWLGDTLRKWDKHETG